LRPGINFFLPAGLGKVVEDPVADSFQDLGPANISLFWKSLQITAEDVAPTYNTIQINEYFIFVKAYVQTSDIGLDQSDSPTIMALCSSGTSTG
jgi:hypothetical protein